MARKVIAGVYSITNLVNNKIYIGSSNDTHERFLEHKRRLRKNNHINNHLQNAWNKYGENNFIFSRIEVIEFSNREKLLEREQFWMNETKCADRSIGYNINPIANSPLGVKLTEERKDHLRNISKNKPILQFDLDGILIKEWLGQKWIKRELGYDINNVIKRDKRYLLNGYIWLYKSEYEKFGLNLEEYTYSIERVKIVQLDLELKFIKIWDSLTQIREELGFDDSDIIKCCKYKRISSNGFCWFYKIEYDNGALKLLKRNGANKYIVQLDLDDNLIRTWDSIKEASLFITNKASCCISECLCKKNKTAYGFKWMYKEDYENKFGEIAT